MRTSGAAWETGIFLVCVPGVVACGIPLLIVTTDSGAQWQGHWASATVG